MFAWRSLVIVLILVLFFDRSIAYSDPTPTPTPRAVPDSQVDSIIDPRFSPQEHAIIKQSLLSLRPDQRTRGFILRTIDGKIHASSCDGLAFEVHEQLIRAGLAIATPDGTDVQPLVRAANYPAAASCGIQIPASGRIDKSHAVPEETPSSASKPGPPLTAPSGDVWHFRRSVARGLARVVV
jgi:hypothetical protein